MRASQLVRAAALFALAGCGVGGIAAASGGGGGGGGGSPKPPAPPTSVTTRPTQLAVSDLVVFPFTLLDPQVDGTTADPGGAQDPRVRVEPQFQVIDADPLNDDVWTAMTPTDLPANDGTRALPLGSHTFVWNSVVDLGAFIGRVRVRVLASYEETSGLKRRFRISGAEFTVDNRVTATVFGDVTQPQTDVDVFPTDVRADASGVYVASFGANIVERVNDVGVPSRVLGFGIPGDNLIGTNTPRNPGVARLPTLSHFDLDPAGNIVSNHSIAILVTNRGGGNLDFGTLNVASQTTAYAANLGTAPDLAGSRGLRRHPSGAYIFLTNGVFAGPGTGPRIEAFNPADPSGGPGSITLSGIVIPPGGRAVIAGGGTPEDAAANDPNPAPAFSAALYGLAALGIGPDGEIYVCEQSRNRVRVLNPNAFPVTLGGVIVNPGEVRTIAGTGVPGPASSGDGALATSAPLNLPSSIDVRASDRAVFIADSANIRVRLVNLGVATITFAETSVAVGRIDTVVGTDPDGSGGGVGSKAADIVLQRPNAVAVNPSGNLVVAEQRTILFVNGSTATVDAYGKTIGAARTALIYDASRRGGLPLTEPRAMHSTSPSEVYFTDESTVRALNLSTTTRVFGGDSADAGGVANIGGGAVTGFAGDGGSARAAAFNRPSALAQESARRLYVADTGNGRVRFVNTGDPLLGGDTEVVFGQTVLPGNVATVIGGGPPGQFQDGDGLTPGACSLLGPEGVAVGGDSIVYVSDTGHHRVRAVNPGATAVTVAGVSIAPGTIRTIVGTGAPGVPPEGAGPWPINSPSAITLDTRNVLYVALRGNSKIMALNLGSAAVTIAGVTIAPNEMRTLVGTGVSGNGGDGGSGPAARIASPVSLFVQSRSGADTSPVALYFADEGSHVVRMLNLSSTDDLAVAYDGRGVITVTAPAAGIVTIAGGPNAIGFPNPPAFQGDGDEASRVRFNRPFGIAVTNRGGQPSSFFIADGGNRRIRRFAAPPLIVTSN